MMLRVSGRCSIATAQKVLRDLHSRPVVSAPVIDFAAGIYLYGAGELGDLVVRAMRLAGVEPLGVIDRQWLTRRDAPTEWNGVPVIPYENLPALVGTSCIAMCVSRVPLGSIVADPPVSILDSGRIVSGYDLLAALYPRQPVRNGWTTLDLSTQDWDLIHEVLALVEDDSSRAHLLGALAWRHLREEWSFPEFPLFQSPTGGTRYDLEWILPWFRNGDVIVDVGAYRGSFLSQILQSRERPPESYLAFEPDPKNRLMLISAANELGAPQWLELSDLAVGSSAGVRPFAGGLGYASQFSLSVEGDMPSVAVVPLHEVAPAFDVLKIHCEGSDLEVLEGSVELAVESNAAICTTLYHTPQSFIGVLNVLTRLAGRRTFVRAQGHLGCGLVAFSIPPRGSLASGA